MAKSSIIPAFKSKRQSIAWDALVINELNAREADNLDTESIVPQLLHAGKVLDPLHVEVHPKHPGKYRVLRGNRRISGVQKIMREPGFTDEQKVGFEKIDCIVYHDLTGPEWEDLVYDQGGIRPLSRFETVIAVERLMKQGHNYPSIIERLYSQLARYCGNEKQLATLPKDDPTDRKKKLATWFRGSVDQYIMYAFQQGSWVRAEFLKTVRLEDGRAPEKDNPIQLKFTRDAMKELWAAKVKDGANWKPYLGFTQAPAEEGQPDNPREHNGGGEEYNKVIDKWVNITLGKTVKAKEPTSRKSAELTKMAAVYEGTPIVQAALKYAAGDDSAGADMQTLAQGFERLDHAMAIIAKHWSKVKDPTTKHFLKVLLSDSPTGDVETALKELCE